MERIRESDLQVLDILYYQPDKVEVSKVQHRLTNLIYCMKKIYVINVATASENLHESLAMATLKHENIVKLKSVSLSGTQSQITHVLIFTDFFEEGDLSKYIKSLKSPLPEYQILTYLHQLVSAYAYMQSLKIAHRDIKPQNILMANKGQSLKVGDLGSAVFKTSCSGITLVGTPLYLSPILRQALIRSGDHSQSVDHNVYKSDVYSLGLTFLYLASLEPIVDLINLDNLQEKINQRIAKLERIYPRLAMILPAMLSVDEAARVDFLQLFEYLDKLMQELTLRVQPVINTMCIQCKREFNDNQMINFDNSAVCKECFDQLENKFYPKCSWKHLKCKSDIEINRDFYCRCNVRFCRICKEESHQGMTCLVNALKISIANPSTAFKCGCGYQVTRRSKSIFLKCHSGHHYFCIVCSLNYNESEHNVCLTLFSGTPLN